MTRSFGDLYFKQPNSLVLGTPDSKVTNLEKTDLFVVLVTDGIMDVMNNQEVVDL